MIELGIEMIEIETTVMIEREMTDRNARGKDNRDDGDR